MTRGTVKDTRSPRFQAPKAAKASQEEMEGKLEGAREASPVAQAEKEKALQEMACMREKTKKDVEVGGKMVGLWGGLLLCAWLS